MLVLDKTGSMTREYRDGVVRRVVERMVPVATQLDDDGTLECYLYADAFLALPDLRVEHLDAWLDEFVHLRGVHGGLDYDGIGFVNSEIPIMREIVSQLRAGDPVPTLVLFFTDGGFSNRRPIIKLITEAAHLPAFWQFVGIGKRGSFGVLEKLDDMGGRVIDNVDFFPVQEIDRMSDDELYRLLLTEFPDWLSGARSLGIVG
nr:VWA domain-containing protein [Pseudoclavibacter chungangensis]